MDRMRGAGLMLRDGTVVGAVGQRTESCFNRGLSRTPPQQEEGESSAAVAIDAVHSNNVTVGNVVAIAWVADRVL